jgi:GxxExxY protein
MGKLIHEALSKEIIGAAMTVLNELKPELDEKLYERALVIELRERSRKISQQKRFTVTYKDHDIGTLIPDLIVDQLVIVDTKGRHHIQRVSHRPDDRLPQPYRPTTRAPPELQARQTAMETHRPLTLNTHAAAGGIRKISVIRGSPRNPLAHCVLQTASRTLVNNPG